MQPLNVVMAKRIIGENWRDSRGIPSRIRRARTPEQLTAALFREAASWTAWQADLFRTDLEVEANLTDLDRRLNVELLSGYMYALRNMRGGQGWVKEHFTLF